MTDYAITVRVAGDFDEVVQRTREKLSEQGFGVLTEIDVAATMKTKLGVELPRQLILGACNPPLAHQALQAEPSIGVLLPCNVVVRATGAGQIEVEAMDPSVMVSATDNPELEPIATQARARLDAALASVQSAPAPPA